MTNLAEALPVNRAATQAAKNLFDSLDRQASRLLRLSFPREDGPSDRLLVNRLSASEGLSQDFRYEVEVLSSNERIPLKSVLGKMVTVQLVREDGGLRYFNGYVFEFRFLRNDGGVAYYKMVLSPWLGFLRSRKDNFIFHQKTVADQTQEIFTDYGPLADWKSSRLGNDPVMTDAVQFDESDYNYLHRRWEALGWHYWYEHRLDGHTLVLCGDSTQAESIEGGSPNVPWQAQAGSDDRDSIDRFSPVRQLVSTRVTTSSFDFKNPKPQHGQAMTLNQQGEVPTLEVYEYSGAYGFANQSAGDDHSLLRMQEIEARAKHFQGDGDHRALMPGRYFHLTDESGVMPTGDDDSQDYLVITVSHIASNNYEQLGNQPSQYSNELTCLRRKIPWHPGRGFNSVEPKVGGLQTAIVVGPPGEELHSDEYGRVRVQYHWDREGQYDERSSAWVRVSSPWAGEGMGGVSIPRAGQEVVISFLDGNPDRPLIIGRVFNGGNMPPFGMEVSGMRSKTVKGSGYNEMTMHDSPGAQLLNMQAEKDMSTLVKNDQTNTISSNKNTSVGANHTESVGVDQTMTVGANQSLKVGANQDHTVGGNRSATVSGNDVRSVTGTSTTTVTGAVTQTYQATHARNVTGNFTDAVQGNWQSALTGNYAGTVQGSWNESVTGSSTRQVTGALKQTYLAGRSTQIVGTDSRGVDGPVEDSNQGPRTIAVNGPMEQSVSSTCKLTSAGNMTVASDAKVEVVVGGAAITIDSGSIVITAAGSTITVNAGGVSINGAKINLN